MRLLVVRHAIAMDRAEFHREQIARVKATGKDEDIENSDDLRPLTDDGIKKMRRNARGLAELVAKPDLLLASPLVRAQQTAVILSAVWLGLKVTECEELQPGTEASVFCNWLKAQSLDRDRDALIAIVGHEPNLSGLVSWFLCGQTKSLFELKKGGACLLDFPAGAGKASGRFQWLATPSMLRACK
jgi:phosphohistidine phosphatase